MLISLGIACYRREKCQIWTPKCRVDVEIVTRIVSTTVRGRINKLYNSGLFYYIPNHHFFVIDT